MVMVAKPPSPRVGLVFTLALVTGAFAAFLAIVVGVGWLSYNYPDSNIAPVMAFVWFAPIAFVVAFVIALVVGLAHELPWRDKAGVSLATRLVKGDAPLSVAFLIPLALLMCLLPLMIVGRTLERSLYYPLFIAIVSLVETALGIAWMYLTWHNAKNAKSFLLGTLAKAVTLLYVINSVIGLVAGLLRSPASILALF